MSELTIDQLERMSSTATGTDYARIRRENQEALRLCDELEALDKERAADWIEEVLAFWRDPLTGYPLPGFESPRFLDARRDAYHDWLMSEAGARTRRNVHPGVDELVREGRWESYVARQRDEER